MRWWENDRRLFLIATIALMALLFVFLPWPQPALFADNYAIAARRSLFDMHFWASDRPFTLYFLYKLCAYDPFWVTVAQRLFHCVAWPLLGWAVARKFANRSLRYACLAVFALAACSWRIAGWAHVLLSESLALSLFAFWLVCLRCAWQEERPALAWYRGWWPALWLVTFLFSFTRDHLAYFLPVAVLPIAIVAQITRRNRRRWWLFAGWIALLFIAQSLSSDTGRRHVFPLINVMLQRVLPDDTATAWFEARGAPLDLLRDAPLEWRGEWASSHDFALLGEARYAPFKAWIREDAKGVYARYLLGHPGYTLGSAWSARDTWYAGDVTNYTVSDGIPLLSTISAWLWSPVDTFWLILFIPAAGFVAITRRNPIPAAILIAALSNGLVIYHADAMEPERHGLFVGIAVMTAGWLAVCALFRRCDDQASAPAPSTLASSAMEQ